MAPTLLLLTLALAPADGSTAPDAAATVGAEQQDYGDLQGLWDVVCRIDNGEPKTDKESEFGWHFGDGTFFLTKDGMNPVLEESFTVDRHCYPPTIVFRSGPPTGAQGRHWIFQARGDSMVLAIRPDGRGLPRDLTSVANCGVVVVVLRRVKK